MSDREGPHPIAAVSEFALGGLLRRLRAGELVVADADGHQHVFRGSQPGPSAEIEVRDRTFARRMLVGRDLALAEGYMDGRWDSRDLKAVLDLGLANLSAGWLSGVPFVRGPLNRLVHRLRDNDPAGGAKRNIAYHYDLGNEFYRLWLDDTMTYSSACYECEGGREPDEPVEAAQRRKWDRLLELIQPTRSDHLLEIGCGWGGFAVHAAEKSGCRVTGLTLSQEQARFARERVRERDLEGRVDIRLEDYRQVQGSFSAVASIEMFEAVGERWWPAYFSRIADLLKSGRPAAVQVITIDDDRYETYRDHPDFIQRYVFPGGMLPSPERFRTAAEAAGLTVGVPRFFGADYARTLKTWSERFEAAIEQVRGLGFDERFIRLWRYYLAYCRAGFEFGSVDVMQVRLEA